MTGCVDCGALREYLMRQPKHEATTGQIELFLGWNGHKLATHRRHMHRDGELVMGRLRRANRVLFIEPPHGRERWHHLLSLEEDRELGALGLRRTLEDMMFIFQAVPPRGSSHRGTATTTDTARLPLADGLPCATKGAESFGDYTRRLSGMRLEVATKADGTIQRELVRVLRSDTAKVG